MRCDWLRSLPCSPSYYDEVPAERMGLQQFNQASRLHSNRCFLTQQDLEDHLAKRQNQRHSTRSGSEKALVSFRSSERLESAVDRYCAYALQECWDNLGCLIPLAATPDVEVKTVHLGGMLSQVDVPGAARAAAQKGRGGDVRGHRLPDGQNPAGQA